MNVWASLTLLELLGDRQHVKPQCAAFVGHDVGDVDALFGLFGTRLGTEHITGETDGNTDIAPLARSEMYLEEWK